MPIERIELKDFDQRLVLDPPADNIPVNALRRARGVHPIKTKSLRSRFGCESLYSLALAHSLERFNDVRFQGVGTALYRDGTSIQSGLSGDRLTFVKMPPTPGMEDYLFVCGGGTLFKVDSSGNVTNWGIAAPADGFTAALGSQLSKSIETFEDYTTWTTVGVTAADEATIKLVGTNSLKLTVAKNTKASIAKSVTLDLSLFSSTGDSSTEDYIVFQARIDGVENLAYMQIDFSLNDTTFNNSFTRQIEQHPNRGKNKREKGLATLEDASQPDLEVQMITDNDASQDTSYYNSPETYEAVTETLSDDTFQLEEGAWKQIKIAKGSFMQTGSKTYSWDDVKALRIVAKANNGQGGVIVYLDDMKMIGGTGLQGTYKHYITYLNSTTGSRSNPNPTAVITEDVLRQSIDLAALPESSDSQVDKIEIWRTIGNGTIPFKVTDQSDATATFTDNYADMWAMDTRETAEYLSSTELTFDNAPPESDFSFACGPHNASCFWLSSGTGEKGRVYYSPIGRPESVDGFINVTSDSEPLQCLIMFSGGLFAFSTARVFQILGENPYYAREVYKVPGTEKPFTVKATPLGIVYQAHDGIRLFNGANSQLAGFGSIGRILRGEDAENLTSFVGEVAEFAKGEYFISDGAQTLALAGDETWRDLGLGFSSLFFEDDGGALIGGLDDAVVSVEVPGVYSDVGDDITIAWDTAHVTLPGDPLVEVCLVEIHADTGGKNLACSVILDDVVLSLGNVLSTSRTITTFNVNRQARRFAVRLTGSVDAQVEVYKIVFEVKDVMRRRQ